MSSKSLNVEQREPCRDQPAALTVSRKLCLCGFGVAVRSAARIDGRNPDAVLASYLQNGVLFCIDRPKPMGLSNTENRFVILRVDDTQVRRMLSALEERTGRAPRVVGQRKSTR